ncbi:MAG: 4Fe-4S binding protein [Desulfohalobiaceae bacterium]
MATTAKIEVQEQNPLAAIQELCRSILHSGDIQALLVPTRLPEQGGIMPTLITEPAQMDQVDPLAPCFALNAAKLVSRLTRGEVRGKIGAVLRPCEVRAFVELVKLNQGNMDYVLLISMDCFGALSNADFQALLREKSMSEITDSYLQALIQGPEALEQEFELARACTICEHPQAEAADLGICLAGLDISSQILLKAHTPRGEGLLSRMGYEDYTEPNEHQKALESLQQRRTAARDELLEATREATQDLNKLRQYLSGCVNCYNCRVACPVCYCRECVFNTDVFEHQPNQYLGWACRQGSLKMPTDTVFFHLTRLAHMSLSCIGCGQCSNACPNNIPVMELFRSTAQRTQQAFGYQPGLDPDQPIPLTVFAEQEFEDVVDHLA